MGLLDFSGSPTRPWRILGPAEWVSWIPPDLLRSICVDVAGLSVEGCDGVGLLDFSGPVEQRFCVMSFRLL